MADNRRLALLLLVLAVIQMAAPAAGQEDVEGLGDALIRHPLQLPPPPPTVFTNYLNLTGEEVACISLGIAVYLETVSLIGRAIAGEDGVVRIGGYEIPESSLDELEYLATIFYTASIHLAVGNYDRAEALIQDVGYNEVSRRMEAIGDALKISTVRGNNMSLAAAVVSITPLLTCIDDDPPVGRDVVDMAKALEVQRSLVGSLNLTGAVEDEVLANLSMMVTYQIATVLEAISPDTGYKIYKGPGLGGQIYLFQLSPCQDPASNEAWDRVACLIPNTFPTRLHMLPSLLLAQRIGGDTWILPLPGEEATGYYDTINKLQRFSEVYQTLLQETIQVNLTLTREEPQAQLPDLGDIDPVNLEQELREILRERRLQDEAPSEPPPRDIQEPVQEVKVGESITEIARIRLQDFRDILRSVTGVSERLNASLQVQAPSARPGLDGAGVTGIGAPLGLGLPAVSPLILLVPILVFAAYMARDHLAAVSAMLRGIVSRRIGVGAPEPVLCYEAALRAVERRGVYKLPSETPREFLDRVRHLLDPSEVRGLEAATRVYEEYKYAGVEPPAQDLGECWRSVRGLLRPWGSLRRR